MTVRRISVFILDNGLACVLTNNPNQADYQLISRRKVTLSDQIDNMILKGHQHHLRITLSETTNIGYLKNNASVFVSITFLISF